jgi:hypothetical protein
MQSAVVGHEMPRSSLPFGTFRNTQVAPPSVVTRVPPSPATKHVVAEGQAMADMPDCGFGDGTTVQVSPPFVVTESCRVEMSVA